jgi:metal-responsive CopG/Arc/MetJ family transcriptional regulator
MMVPGKKIKVSLNIDKNILNKLDEEIKNHFKDEYSRLQRSRMIEFIISKFLER